MGAKIELKGRLGRDPKLGQTHEGQPWLSFSLKQDHMVRTGNKLSDGRDEYEDKGGFWMEVVWFNRKAEKAAQLLKKGAAVIVTGDLRAEQWENKETGEWQSGFKVVANEVALDMLSLDSVSYTQPRQSSVRPHPNVGQHSKTTNTEQYGVAASKTDDMLSEPMEAFDDDMPF